MSMRKRGVILASMLIILSFAVFSCNSTGTASLGTTISIGTNVTTPTTKPSLLPKSTDTIAFTPTETSTITSTPFPHLYAKKVAAGSESTCVITISGGVKCWGSNGAGRLGDGTNEDRQFFPVDVVGLSSGVVDISIYDEFACAVTSAGGVKCWGSNIYGNLGDNHASGDMSNVPVDVVGLSSGVIDVAVGTDHACAVLATGGVKCWGYNYRCELGNKASNISPIPVDVNGLSSGVAAISTGNRHTCALMKNGGVKCWGSNPDGQLGVKPFHGDYSECKTYDVEGLSNGAIAIGAGDYSTCALLETGGVKCWGANGGAYLGDGTMIDSYSPVDVVGLDNSAVAISVGAISTCVLMSNAGVKCWGKRQFPSESADWYLLVPTDVPGLDMNVAFVSVGPNHSCAIMQDGAVKCWGYDALGLLGNGADTRDLVSPVDVICPDCGSTSPHP
jgi:alpha-tubulin suppressor-like RCC1 family protein